MTPPYQEGWSGPASYLMGLLYSTWAVKGDVGEPIPVYMLKLVAPQASKMKDWGAKG